jgi:aminoacylase
LGDVLTLNVTSINAKSLGHNVIPSQAECVVDIRVPLHINDIDEFIKKEILDEELCKYTEIEFIQKTSHPEIKCEENIWFEKIKKSIPGEVDVQVFPAATDSRFYRTMKKIPCFGFSPIKYTPVLLHDHNEWISVAGLEAGVDVYVKMLAELLS